MPYLCDVRKIGEREWRSYVCSHRFGNVFQTPEFYRVLGGGGSRSLGVAVLNDDGLQGLVVGGVTSYFGVVSRLSVQGGPLVSRLEYVPLLVSSLGNFLGGFGVTGLIDIKNYWGVRSLGVGLAPLGYRFEDHLNYIVDIGGSPGETWSGIPRNRRKSISRAMGRGFVVSDVASRGDVLVVYELVRSTYRRVGVPAPGLEFFVNAFRHLGGSIVGKVAYDGELPVAARVFLTYKDTVYDWFAGSLVGGEAGYSNELLVWCGLEFGSLNGFRFFDFGGAGHPLKPYGPREFKRRFGGRLVNYGKFVRVVNEPVFRLVARVAGLRYAGIGAQL